MDGAVVASVVDLWEDVGMSTAKDDVRQMLDQIPEDASYEDIQYHIYVRQKIAKGLEDVKQGRVISQEQVERRMAAWLEK